jgi:DNA ligase (NAD+)
MIKSLSRAFARWAAAHVELHPSQICPECGSQLAREADDASGVWRCLNPDCPPEVLRRVTLWVSSEAMDIQGCDAALIKQLVQCGLVRDAADFYQLSVAELAGLDGMTETRARELQAAMEASKQREAWRVLYGLGIRNLGSAEAQALCGQFASLPELFAAARNPMPALTGVDDVVVRQLKRWLGDPVNRKLVRRLTKAGINFDTRSAPTKPAK